MQDMYIQLPPWEIQLQKFNLAAHFHWKFSTILGMKQNSNSSKKKKLILQRSYSDT